MWCLETQTGQATGAFEQYGLHPIEFSCSTQHVIALLSGEAELYATGRAAAGGLQSVQLLVEAGMEPKLEVLTDSSANHGMHNRIGSGRVRHLDVKWLWTQEAVQSGKFSLQRERFDDETSPRRQVGCLDVFGKTAICQRTRGRSLGPMRAGPSR